MNKILCTVALLLASTSISFSQELDFDPCSFSVPPDEFVTNISQWPDELVLTKDKERVRIFCKIPVTHVAYGCFYKSGVTGKTLIMLYDTGDSKANACILKHEMAHVNGWRHN